MAGNYDVASRLAQGLPAVETVQRYVLACHRLGYQHHDLTLHPAQVTDWYSTEDGMDLSALQQGCLALDAAVRSSQEALSIQERQLAEMPTVWRGVGGQAAHQFLRRHSDASATVAAAVQTAADALAALREELWRAVGAKVDAVVAIEGRTAGTRAEWSAASATVTTGAGDQAAASELVDQAVKPFVDNMIGTEWLGAMRTATGSVAAAYERAVAEIDAEPAPVFDVPGDFGPSCPPAEPRCVSAETECDEPRSAVSPAPAPSTPAPAPTAPAAAWTAPPVEPVAPAAPPAPPPTPPLGAMGPALPELGGGLSGLGQQFADSLGGLLGGAGGIGGELPEPPEPDLGEPEELDLEGPEEDEPEEDDVVEDEPADEQLPAEEVIETGEAAPVEETPCEPAPEPPPPPPPAEPLPPAEPVAAESTPCEVAAGEVPQVGEPGK